MQNAPLIITHSDFEKISALLHYADSVTAELLQEELDRATIVQAEDLPVDVVAVNSIVKFQDLDSGKISTRTLVMPNDANVEEKKISILAPMGAALIGLRVGQTISWPVPRGGEKRVHVLSVLKPAEAAGVSA